MIEAQEISDADCGSSGDRHQAWFGTTIILQVRLALFLLPGPRSTSRTRLLPQCRGRAYSALLHISQWNSRPGSGLYPPKCVLNPLTSKALCNIQVIHNKDLLDFGLVHSLH